MVWLNFSAKIEEEILAVASVRLAAMNEEVSVKHIIKRFMEFQHAIIANVESIEESHPGFTRPNGTRV